MTPQELSATLVRIANKIDASKNPSRELVAASLKQVLAAVEGRSHTADWKAVHQAWPDVARKFVKLQALIKKEDSEAANLAGAVGGLLQDMGEAMGE